MMVMVVLTRTRIYVALTMHQILFLVIFFILTYLNFPTNWPGMFGEVTNNHAIICLYASCIYCSNYHVHLPDLYLFCQILHKTSSETILNLPEQIILFILLFVFPSNVCPLRTGIYFIHFKF